MKTSTKIKTVIAATIIFFVGGIKAQRLDTYDYQNAIGLRGGETSGLTFKHKAGNNAFEGIVSVWPYRLGVTGLFEKNLPTAAPGLNWYFGAGGHVNFGPMYRGYYFYYRGDRYAYVESANRFGLGIDGILGLEYKIKPIPFAISADIKPFIETGNYGYTFFALDPSLGIKFTF